MQRGKKSGNIITAAKFISGFYRAASMQAVLSMIQMSVCPFVKRVNCDKMKKNFCQN